MNQHKVEDHMAFIYPLYPDVYTQMVPQQGGSKAPRRRRKKNKGSSVDQTSHVGVKKKKLSEEQVNLLETSFRNEHKLESERKDRLASDLGLEPHQVAVWFQNRRARWKTKQLEDEYSKLKNVHENVVVEKCRLESEVVKLKEQLFEAEREIQRLAERVEGASSSSPSSSLTVEAMDVPFFGNFTVEDGGYDTLFYAPENNYINGMEWMSLYM